MPQRISSRSRPLRVMSAWRRSPPLEQEADRALRRASRAPGMPRRDAAGSWRRPCSRDAISQEESRRREEASGGDDGEPRAHEIARRGPRVCEGGEHAHPPSEKPAPGPVDEEQREKAAQGGREARQTRSPKSAREAVFIQKKKSGLDEELRAEDTRGDEISGCEHLLRDLRRRPRRGPSGGKVPRKTVRENPKASLREDVRPPAPLSPCGKTAQRIHGPIGRLLSHREGADATTTFRMAPGAAARKEDTPHKCPLTNTSQTNSCLRIRACDRVSGNPKGALPGPSPGPRKTMHVFPPAKSRAPSPTSRAPLRVFPPPSRAGMSRRGKRKKPSAPRAAPGPRRGAGLRDQMPGRLTVRKGMVPQIDLTLSCDADPGVNISVTSARGRRERDHGIGGPRDEGDAHGEPSRLRGHRRGVARGGHRARVPRLRPLHPPVRRSRWRCRTPSPFRHGAPSTPSPTPRRPGSS